KAIVAEATEEISKVESRISEMVRHVFPGYAVSFDARAEENVADSISFFKEKPQLLMGPGNGYQTSIERQGSGARRTLLWTALRILSEHKRSKSEAEASRSHLLLMDEPELCLHPD